MGNEGPYVFCGQINFVDRFPCSIIPFSAIEDDPLLPNYCMSSLFQQTNNKLQRFLCTVRVFRVIIHPTIDSERAHFFTRLSKSASQLGNSSLPFPILFNSYLNV